MDEEHAFKRRRKNWKECDQKAIRKCFTVKDLMNSICVLYQKRRMRDGLIRV